MWQQTMFTVNSTLVTSTSLLDSLTSLCCNPVRKILFFPAIRGPTPPIAHTTYHIHSTYPHAFLYTYHSILFYYYYRKTCVVSILFSASISFIRLCSESRQRQKNVNGLSLMKSIAYRTEVGGHSLDVTVSVNVSSAPTFVRCNSLCETIWVIGPCLAGLFVGIGRSLCHHERNKKVNFANCIEPITLSDHSVLLPIGHSLLLLARWATRERFLFLVLVSTLSLGVFCDSAVHFPGFLTLPP